MERPLRLTTEYRERVWGGQRLRPGDPPIGEAWIVDEGNRVAAGSDAGRTLAELAAEREAALLGRRAVARTGTRFPLLIKLLDTADWLSVQVHPDDEGAARLEGPGHVGKTEAWHILAADEGSRIVCGFRPGTTPEQVAAAVRAGAILDLAQTQAVRPGETVYIAAGTIHALGPGLLLYEVQQTSDLTYRVYDWDRPQAAGRALHLDRALAVMRPTATGEVRPPPDPAAGDRQELVACPFFRLEALLAGDRPVALDTAGETFHAVTATAGGLRLEGDGWSEALDRYETVVVPAAAGAYRAAPVGGGGALVASVP
jgi:mannose-6-phosphate isomerase